MKRERVKAGTSRAAAAERRRLFIEAYIANGCNATAAAIAAGFPQRSAHVRGAELVKDRKVAGELERRRAEGLAKAKLTADEVLASLARDIRFDPAKLYRPDGSLKKIHELDEDTRLALRSVEFEEITAGRGENAAVIGNTVKVKFPEKTAARDQAMRHFGLYESDNKQQADLIRQFMAAVSGHSRGLPGRFKPPKGAATDQR